MKKAWGWFCIASSLVVCAGGYAAVSRCVVRVAGPAVVERPRTSLASEAPSRLSYSVQLLSYGESGPHPYTINAIPSHVLAAFDGQLLGSDRGEWGGELMFRDHGGVDHRLVDHNVVGIVRMPFGVVAFTGLAHLGRSTGAIYNVRRRADGTVAASLLGTLPGAPRDIRWTTHGELVFQVDVDSFPRRGPFGGHSARCMVLDRFGDLRRQCCMTVVDR